MSSPTFRPRSVTELVDAGFQLFRGHAIPLIILSAIGWFPMVVVAFMMMNLMATMMSAMSADPANMDMTTLFLIYPLYIGGALWHSVISAGLQYYAAEVYAGREVTTGSTLKRVFGRFFALLGANFMKWLIIFVGPFMAVVLAAIGTAIFGQSGATVALLTFLAVVVAAVWMLRFLARYVAVPAATIIENLGVMASLRRSRELTRGHLKHVLLTLLLLYVLFMAAYFGLYIGIGMMAPGSFAVLLLAQLVVVAIYPIVDIVIALLYYDLRIRSEGLDLELMARTLDAPGAGQPAY